MTEQQYAVAFNIKGELEELVFMHDCAARRPAIQGVPVAMQERHRQEILEYINSRRVTLMFDFNAI